MTDTSPDPKPEVVGVIGLGTMGGAMAGNLIEGGFDVIGFDISDACCESLVARGGRYLNSANDVLTSASIVLTSLPSPDALIQIATNFADAQLTSATAAVIETSTLALSDKLEAFEIFQIAGVALLDCPMSGTGAQAVVRDLVVLASGDEEAFNRCAGVFDAISRGRHYLGEFGNGSRMKFVANLMVASHNVVAAEGMVLGMKAGLDPQLIYDVISNSAGSSRMFEIRGPMMVADDYDAATMKMELFQKDLDIISAFTQELGVTAPLFEAGVDLYAEGLAQDRHKQDTASVCGVLADMAKLVR
jgi:3-hydroxyisobutyrate dehydrogenase-like beta-hydroxyacid dehydrogenase